MFSLACQSSRQPHGGQPVTLACLEPSMVTPILLTVSKLKLLTLANREERLQPEGSTN